MAPGKRKRRQPQEEEEEEEEFPVPLPAQIKGKKKTRVTEENESEDEDESGDEEPTHQTRSEKEFLKLPSAVRDQKVAEIVRFVMFRSCNHEPFNLKEIQDKVMGKQYSSAGAHALTKAKKRLKQLFGMDLVELPAVEKKGERPARVQLDALKAPVTSTKQYVLMNSLQAEELQDVLSWEGQKEHWGLLLTVLGYIHMSDYEMSEDQLWAFLNKLGVFKTVQHSRLGHVDKLLNTDFIKQKYLVKVKQMELEGPRYFFRWGPRARAEIDEEDIVTFVAKVYKQDPEMYLARMRKDD